MDLSTKLFVSVFVAFIICNTSAQTNEITDILRHISLENVLQNVSPDDTSDLCRNHLQLMSTNFSNEQIMRMLDSSTKFPESVLTGLFIHLGNYDECVEVQEVENEFGPFTGKHCLASVAILTGSSETYYMDATIQKNEIQRAVNLPENQMERAAAAVPGAFGGLQLSYCIPSTCTGKDFQDFINNALPHDNPNLTIVISIPETSCHTSQGKQLAVEDWVTVGILITIGVLAITSTAYDLLKSEPKSKILTAFSWYSNGKKLLSTETSGDTLQALHGIRFLSMCWVVMGHRYMLYVMAPTINMLSILDVLKDFWRLYLTNATLSVDTFFFLSGLLVCYIFLKEMNRKKASFNIPLYYLHRYIRLTPPYAIIILLHATVIRYISSGPLFDTYTDALAEPCQKNWWTNLLYVNNYVEAKAMCVGQSWYLAVDMQLFLLSPIILYPLWKWPRKLSLSLLIALIFGGLVTAFTVSFVEQLPGTILSGDVDFMYVQYFPTHTRFTPWLIGIGFGYLFHETKKTDKKLSKGMVCVGWCLGIAAMLASLLSIHPLQQNISFGMKPTEFIDKFEASIYTTLSRSVWVLGVGWVAYACVFGYGGPVNTFLSWKVFLPLSRLTYCVYLVHMAYQTVESASVRTPAYFTDLTAIPNVISDVVVSSVFAAVLSLCVESPTIILEKQLLGGGGKSKEKQQSKTEDLRSTGYKDNLNTELHEVVMEIPEPDRNTEKPKIFDHTEEDIIISGHSNQAFVDENSNHNLE